MVLAEERFKGADLLMWEDDGHACPGSFHDFETYLRAVRKEDPDFGMIR